MPDGSYNSGYEAAFGYGVYKKAEAPKPIETVRPKEKDPKNFFEQKRNAWMDSMEDQKMASEIAQSIRALMFAIPEGKTPRSSEETEELYSEVERLVRKKIRSMELPGAYGSGIRYVHFDSDNRKAVFEFIDQFVPSFLHKTPEKDLRALNGLMDMDPEILAQLDDLQPMLGTSERMARFADVLLASDSMSDASYRAEQRRFFLYHFQRISESPGRLYGFHKHWNSSKEESEARERQFEKKKKEHEQLRKDDAFFEEAVDVLEKMFLKDVSGLSPYELQNRSDKLSYQSPENLKKFLRRVHAFSQKGIDPSVYLMEQSFLENADPAKDGLEMFEDAFEKQRWLERCLQQTLSNSSTQEGYASCVKEVLQISKEEIPVEKTAHVKPIKTKGIHPRLQEEFEDEHDEPLSPEAQEKQELKKYVTQEITKRLERAMGMNGNYLELGVFATLAQRFGDDVLEIFQDFDKDVSKKIRDEDLVRFIDVINDRRLKEYCPRTQETLFPRIVSLVGKNAKLTESVSYYFAQFIEFADAEKIAFILAQEFTTAKRFYDQYANPSFAVKQPWIKGVILEIERLYPMSLLKPPKKQQTSGFMDEDPYKNHPYKYAGSSMRLGELMSGRKTPEELKIQLTPEATEFLQEANRVLDEEHRIFLRTVNGNPLIPSEDKIALANPTQSLVKMNDVKDTIRMLVGRYLAQKTFGKLDRLKPDAKQYEFLRDMIRAGYEKYLDVYATDIPLYDKLYDEFDALREAGRSPLEVYLGRDGIYAYIGRKAQDATRKALLGRGKVEALQKEGEIISIQPKYLVYPSYVRDYVNTESKQEYLNYHGVTQEADPFFYDTGYSGSIPQQIMQIMGFDKAQIEERIRLLSAPTAERRMRGISANAKGEVVEKIENNPKSENTASGLVKNPETGHITHSAEPTSPEEQFKFSMIRQAIARHYLIQEKLHFAVPENTILDSEKFTLRIRSEYAERLPDAFKQNPITYLEAQGVSTDGTVLMKLEDGTEVVARRVEWTKSQQAQTEYAILISAKKAGVPAAEPVGFVTGKSKEDESVLLSKKIEGVPGTRFEKTLRASGKYSEEKIAELLTELKGQIEAVTQLLKQTLGIVGNWKVNDVAVQFNEETGVIERVVPLKWEQVKRRDEEKERRVRNLIQS